MKTRVALIGSGKGIVAEGVLRAARHYKIVAAFADRSCRFAEKMKQASVPTEVHLYQGFSSREEYDHHLAERLKLSDPDLILLVGYMRLITKPLLEAFSGRILNVHPADLTLENRRYAGLNAVQRALEEGHRATRSTVIVVDDGVDTGPIVTLGPAVPYHGPYPVTKASAAAHQELQKQLSCIPACIVALERSYLCVE